MEQYTLFYNSTTKKFDNNLDLDDKLFNGYIIKKIIINFDRQLDELIRMFMYYREKMFIPLNKATFYNNQITYLCYIYFTIKYEQITNFLQINGAKNIISVSIFIEKTNFIIDYKDNDTSDTSDETWRHNLTIRSNYFNNIDEIVDYYCLECNTDFEETKNYILKNYGDYSYNLYSSDINERIIYKDENFNRNE